MKHFVDYLLAVDKGILTVVANFEQLTFRALARHWSKVVDRPCFGFDVGNQFV